MRSLAELGKTVLLTTHYLDEAEALADRVGVIARGRLVEVAVPATLEPTAGSAGFVPPGQLAMSYPATPSSPYPAERPTKYEGIVTAPASTTMLRSASHGGSPVSLLKMVARATHPRNQTVRCDDSLRREQVCGYSSQRMVQR